MDALFLNTGTNCFKARAMAVISHVDTHKITSILCFQIKAQL